MIQSDQCSVQCVAMAPLYGITTSWSWDILAFYTMDQRINGSTCDRKCKMVTRHHFLTNLNKAKKNK